MREGAGAMSNRPLPGFCDFLSFRHRRLAQDDAHGAEGLLRLLRVVPSRRRRHGTPSALGLGRPHAATSGCPSIWNSPRYSEVCRAAGSFPRRGQIAPPNKPPNPFPRRLRAVTMRLITLLLAAIGASTALHHDVKRRLPSLAAHSVRRQGCFLCPKLTPECRVRRPRSRCSSLRRS